MMSLGVDAFNILSLTFTNKAAREMKKRISDIVGSSEAKTFGWVLFTRFCQILRSSLSFRLSF
jgi:DNA helicase-2/ATP-dependent DNA helicase PcrA